MPQHFPGLLSNPTEPSSGLRVTLILSGDVVEIETNDTSLGMWKSTDLHAARSDGNWFRLEIENEDWRFLPDTPTEFLFYGVPRITASMTSRRSWNHRFRIAAPDILYLGRITLGAVLAVFLLSIGMLMGRYRLDNSSVAVLAVLIAAAGSGAWWTAAQGRDGRHERPPTSNRPPVLPPQHKRSALSVREVIAAAQMDSSETVPDPQRTEPDGMPRIPERQVSEVVAAATDAVEATVEAPESPDLDEANAWGDADDQNDDRADTAPTRDERTGPTDVSEVSTEVNHFVSVSPDPISSSQRPTSEEVDASEPVAGEDMTRDEFTPSLDPSISIAELIDKTAVDSKPAKLMEKPANRAKEGSPIDLTAIRGIGPALSAALTQLGVTDVRDLAILDTDDLIYLEQRLGRFASGNRARQWVAQAQRIVAETDTHHTV